MKKIIVPLALLFALPSHAEINRELPITAKSAPLIAKMMENKDLSDSNLNDSNLLYKKIIFQHNTLIFEYELRPQHQFLSEDEWRKMLYVHQAMKKEILCANKRYNQLNQYIRFKYVYQLPNQPNMEVDVPINTCQTSDIRELEPAHYVFLGIKQTLSSIALPKKVDELTTIVKIEFDEKQKQIISYQEIDMPKEKFVLPEFKQLMQMGQEHHICDNQNIAISNQFVNFKFVYTSPHAPKHQVVVHVPKQFCTAD